MNSDRDWILWGQRDPYYAVITNPRFRSAALTQEARDEFFLSGQWHAEHVLAACRRVAGEAWAPKRALDFGCGVGRVALPLARHVPQVVGMDVSPAMLAEASRNAHAQGVANVQWRLSDDTLSAAEGMFDLVHSCITFQHIDIPRGRTLFSRLLGLLGEGGVAALQITYAKAVHAEAFGQPPPSLLAEAGPAAGLNGQSDPPMSMNAYHLGEIAWLMQSAGVRRFHADFTDHGGEFGVFLYFAPG